MWRIRQLFGAECAVEWSVAPLCMPWVTPDAGCAGMGEAVFEKPCDKTGTEIMRRDFGSRLYNDNGPRVKRLSQPVWDLPSLECEILTWFL